MHHNAHRFSSRQNALRFVGTEGETLQSVVCLSFLKCGHAKTCQATNNIPNPNPNLLVSVEYQALSTYPNPLISEVSRINNGEQNLNQPVVARKTSVD